MQQQSQVKDSVAKSFTKPNKAIIDIRLRPQCRRLANLTKHNVVLNVGLLAPYQNKTEPLPQVTCGENMVKFGHASRHETDRQTDRQTDMLNAMLVLDSQH